MKHVDEISKKEESLIKSQLRNEMDTGITASRDPVNAYLPPLYARTTTIYSPWYTRTCPECKHKFREGDRVRLCPTCERAYHDDSQYDLHCWQAHFAKSQVCKKGGYDPIAEVEKPTCEYQWNGKFPEEINKESGQNTQSQRFEKISAQFLRGLEKIWRPFGEQKLREVASDDSLVGHNCPWCGFQIRAGDHVVKCPCDNCNTYFHNDIYRHLECWNDWNGSQGLFFCPTTGVKITRDQIAKVERFLSGG